MQSLPPPNIFKIVKVTVFTHNTISSPKKKAIFECRTHSPYVIVTVHSVSINTLRDITSEPVTRNIQTVYPLHPVMA